MSGGAAKVRVRGIYATALTRLLLDEGFIITQASRIIRERLGLPEIMLPADATVKNNDRDPSGLLVLGRRGREVAEALRRRLPHLVFWESPLGLYATVSYRVLEDRGDECLVELPGGVRGVLRPCSRDEGLATVVKAPIKPYEKAGLKPGPSLPGVCSIVSMGGGVSVSEHIHSPEDRARLLALAAEYAEGLGVRWRSNAALCSSEEAARELKRLAEELRRISEDIPEEPRVISPGEYIGLGFLSLPSKRLLDDVRGKITPTVRGHHSLKSAGRGDLGMLVDYTEELLKHGVDPGIVGKALLDYMVSLLSKARSIQIIHRTLRGEVLRLTPGRVQTVLPTATGYRIEVKRVFRSKGLYDALGVEKEPGDYDVMVVETGGWKIIHRYYSVEGVFKGEYVNINTPPELRPDSIEYVDLAVDVVRRPREKPIIVDREELEDAFSKGYISEPLYRKALEEAEALLEAKD